MDKIEVLVVRDPDSETGLEVWLNGKHLSTTDPRYTFDIIDIGAGEPYTAADWQENRDAAMSVGSAAFAAAVAEAYDAYVGTKYVPNVVIDEDGNYQEDEA